MSTSDRSEAPLVTVGLPVYNGEEYIRQAIESVLRQTFTDFELVISDNASTDGTEPICREYAARDPRVRYVRNERNIGAARNYNQLVHLARGRYFKWISHDDYIAPTFLERCVAEMERDPGLVSVAPATLVVDAAGNVRDRLGADVTRTWRGSASGRHRRMLAALFNDPAGLTMAVFEYALHRTALLRRTRLVGSYITSDAVFATELALAGRICELGEPLNHFRVHDNPGSSSVHFRNYDFGAVQQLLDPAHAAGLKLAISRRRRYVEYFVAVARSPAPLKERFKAVPGCFTPLALRMGIGRPTVAGAPIQASSPDGQPRD